MMVMVKHSCDVYALGSTTNPDGTESTCSELLREHKRVILMYRTHNFSLSSNNLQFSS